MMDLALDDQQLKTIITIAACLVPFAPFIFTAFVLFIANLFS